MVTQELIKQYASQYRHLSSEVISYLSGIFGSITDREYLLGLINGYAHSREILMNNGDGRESLNFIGAVLCFVSKRYLELN